jgi:hypothetical protein
MADQEISKIPTILLNGVTYIPPIVIGGQGVKWLKSTPFDDVMTLNRQFNGSEGLWVVMDSAVYKQQFFMGDVSDHMLICLGMGLTKFLGEWELYVRGSINSPLKIVQLICKRLDTAI